MLCERPDYRKVQRSVDALLVEHAIENPPVDPVQIARDRGMSVIFVAFGGEAAGISGFYDCEENAVFVNRDEYPLRQTFTVAHELGHRILHEEWARSNEYKLLLRDPARQEQDFREKEANAFAANLLMPRAMVDLFWQKLSVEQLSQLFAVSVPVVKNRLSFLYGV